MEGLRDGGVDGIEGRVDGWRDGWRDGGMEGEMGGSGEIVFEGEGGRYIYFNI